MANFKVVWEIQLDANNALEAAKTAQSWIQEYGSQCQQYFVQNEETNIVHSVDLNEEDEDALVVVHKYHALIEN